MRYKLWPLAFLAIMSTCISAQGQEEKVSYDKFKDITTVTRVIPLGEEHEQIAGMNLILSFSYPGKVYAKPAKVYFGLSSFSKRWKFLKDADRWAILLIDGDRLDLGILEKSGSEIQGGAIYELVGIHVPPETIQKLAKAKTIEIQVGQFEKELAPHHKTAIKEFGDAVSRE